VNPNGGDLAYRRRASFDLRPRLHEEALLDTDRCSIGADAQARLPEAHDDARAALAVGARHVRDQKQLKVKQPSLLSTAYKYGVRSSSARLQDGSIFLNIVKLRRLLGDEFKLELDCERRRVRDGRGAALRADHFKQEARHLDFGGGRTEELHAAGEPRWINLSVPTTGFDIDVQFCVDRSITARSRAARPAKATSWGKVSVDAVETAASMCTAT